MDTTSPPCPAFFLSSCITVRFSTSSSDQTGSLTHTHIHTHTSWHSPQGHVGSEVMSLIYGESRKADIYRQVLVLHTHTVQRAPWNPLISLYTRSWHNSTFILQHLLSLMETKLRDSRVLQRQDFKHCVICHDCFTVFLFGTRGAWNRIILLFIFFEQILK